MRPDHPALYLVPRINGRIVRSPRAAQRLEPVERLASLQTTKAVIQKTICQDFLDRVNELGLGGPEQSLEAWIVAIRIVRGTYKIYRAFEQPIGLYRGYRYLAQTSDQKSVADIVAADLLEDGVRIATPRLDEMISSTRIAIERGVTPPPPFELPSL